jgi:hypothetical protein
MSDVLKSRPVHENLDTAYVNVAALLRYLRRREFVGRVHIELDEYSADVFLNAGHAPHVHEHDHATGREDEGEAALQRLLIRATNAGGLVSVYEEAQEELSGELHARSGENSVHFVDAKRMDAGGSAQAKEIDVDVSPEAMERRDLLNLSGELIAAVERAALSAGADFNALFHAARLELADDFAFLDPATKRFAYAHGQLELHAQPNAKAFVSGLSEALRRVVNRLATGARGKSVRERVALEFAVLARRRETAMARFQLAPQLDRIAGTRVL